MSKDSRKVGYYLERTTRIVKLKFTQIFSELEIDLTPQQWVIIDALNKENGMSQKALATNSFKDAPTISRIIDLLVTKGFVTREKDEEDRRKFLVKLTPQGKAIIKKVTPKVNALRDQSWNGLSEQDYEEFLRIINKVFENME